MTIGAAAMFAILALPAVATAESVVPPGNSAATQYTETFPTTGGNAKVNSSIGAGGGGGSSHSSGGGGHSPAKALGSETAHQLEAHGQEGHTVAALATESAATRAGEATVPGDNGASGQGGHGAGSGGAEAANGGSLSSEAGSGSSGFSQVLSHATGSGSGDMGIFLPLLLLAAPLCALAYAWRRRHPGRAAP
jgi:hypothetical protein